MALNMSLVRKRRLEIQKQEEDFARGKNWDKLKNGPNKRRILPPYQGFEDWRFEFWTHYGLKEKGDVVCPKTWDKPCPACEANSRLYKSENSDDKEFAKKIRAKHRFVANVLNLDLNDSKVYVLEFGEIIEGQIISIIDPGGDSANSTEVFGLGDITNPQSGRNLLITMTQNSQNKQLTDYDVKASQTPSAVANWSEIEKNLVNLEAHVVEKLYSYDDMVKMLEGTFKEDGGSASPATTPTVNQAGQASPVQDEFGNAVNTKTTAAPAQVTDEFVAPTGQAPTVSQQAPVPTQNPVVPASQPAKTMSALEKLKAMKGQK